MYIIINFYSNYGTLLYTKILLESCKNLYTLSCCVTLWMLSCHGLCGIGINPIPLIVSKKTYTFPQILGKNGFHFLHSSLHCLGMKGFCYSKNKKEYQSWQKELRKGYNFFGWYLRLRCSPPSVPPSEIICFPSFFCQVYYFLLNKILNQTEYQ